MKTKLFRTVSVEDRLPQKEGRYLVLNQGQWHEAYYCEQYSFHEEMTNCAGITHWMEEVELPSEEEIKEQFEIKGAKYNLNNAHRAGCIKGASFILNHIKGGG